jgi:hypothetical protein
MRLSDFSQLELKEERWATAAPDGTKIETKLYQDLRDGNYYLLYEPGKLWRKTLEPQPKGQTSPVVDFTNWENLEE